MQTIIKSFIFIMALSYFSFANNVSENFGLGFYTSIKTGPSIQTDPEQNYLHSFEVPRVNQFGIEAHLKEVLGFLRVSASLNYLSATEELLNREIEHQSYSLLIPINIDFLLMGLGEGYSNKSGLFWTLFGGYSLIWVQGSQQYLNETNDEIKVEYNDVFPLGFVFGMGPGLRLGQYEVGLEGAFSSLNNDGALDVEISGGEEPSQQVKFNNITNFSLNFYFRYFFTL